MADSPEAGLTAIKTLFAWSNNVCAFQDPTDHRGCEKYLTDPKWEQVQARICHIRGKLPGSARYDETMTNAERGDFDNLILLCPNHHTQVDDLEPSRFTVEILTEMKLNAMENVEPGRWDTHNLIDQAVIALQLAMARLGEPLPKVSMSPPTPGSTGRVIHDESRTDDSIARPDRATARLEAVELGMNQVLGYGVAVFTRALPGGSFEFEIDRDLSDTEREALNNLATERRTGFEIRTVGDTVWAFTPGQASSEQPE